jgi:hypothetical protein
VFILVLGRWFLEADNDTILLLLTPTLAFFGVIYSAQVNKSRDIAEQNRLKKAETYQALFDYLDYFYENPDLLANPNSVVSEKMRKITRKLSEGMLIWSSPLVVKTWLRFRQIRLTDENGLDVMDDLIRAIRVDLRNGNDDLLKGDLIKVYLKTPQDYEDLSSMRVNKANSSQ